MNWSSKMQSNHSARWFHWKDSESNAKVRDEGCAEKDESGPTHWDARQRNPSVKLTMKLRWKRIHSLMSNEKQKEEEKKKKRSEERMKQRNEDKMRITTAFQWDSSRIIFLVVLWCLISTNKWSWRQSPNPFCSFRTFLHNFIQPSTQWAHWDVSYS